MSWIADSLKEYFACRNTSHPKAVLCRKEHLSAYMGLVKRPTAGMVRCSSLRFWRQLEVCPHILIFHV